MLKKMPDYFKTKYEVWVKPALLKLKPTIRKPEDGMKIEVQRYNVPNIQGTFGVLSINGDFECFTLEDEARTKKKYGDTAIPDGTYEIKLRNAGDMHQRYNRRFPYLHKGMLELQNVPNYTYIYIHIGNKITDTLGCILVGNSVVKGENTVELMSSTPAYKQLYRKVLRAMELKESVIITLTGEKNREEN